MKIKEEVSDSENKQEFIALVDQPAVEVEWFEFSKQEKFKFSYDDQRQILTGVALVADMPIYRKMKLPGQDAESEFYIVFDKTTVFDFVKKFMKNAYTKNFNLHHDDTMKTEDVFLFESIVVDSTRGVSAPKMFDGISDGSWIISAQVESKESWNKIKEEGLHGFSVQGYFGLDYIKDENAATLENIADMAKP
jgi:hypothetical protein